MERTVYIELAPPEALRRIVECCWSVCAERGKRDFMVLPDGCMDIVFRPKMSLTIVGPMTRCRMFDLPAHSRIFGVRFRPGQAFELFPGVAPQTVDKALSLELVWGTRGRRLHERLMEARTTEEVHGQLLSGLRVSSREPHPVEYAVAAIASSHGNLSLDELARQSNLSTRQFRRRSIEVTGYSPKLLSRVLRFRRAASLLAAGHSNYAELALSCGYYDQAHMIREFREFAAVTPSEYAAHQA